MPASPKKLVIFLFARDLVVSPKPLVVLAVNSLNWAAVATFSVAASRIDIPFRKRALSMPEEFLYHSSSLTELKVLTMLLV